MSIYSYFTVKQRDLPKLETVVSVAEAVRTEVKRTIGVKHVRDEEGESSESKRVTTIDVLYYKYIVYQRVR